MSEPGGGHWVHDLSPFLVRFGEGFGIRWYGLAYLAGLVAGFAIAVWWYRRGRFPLDPRQLQDAIVYIGLGMILGGRLYYCIFYFDTPQHDPPFALLHDPLVIFRVWEGGMASHGGIIGLFVGVWLFYRKMRKRFDLWVLADVTAAVAPIGVFFGRIANFINGELWGRPTDVPWAMKFPDAIPYGDPRIPAPPEPKYSPGWYEWAQAFAQPRHPSQLYAAGLEGLLVLAVCIPFHLKHKRPGCTVGMACVVYGIGRFVGEFFREPDAGYELYFGWMSKGQLYTVPMFLAGVLLIWWKWRAGPRPEAYLPLEEGRSKIEG